MVVSMPRKGITRTDEPDMVRVQLKPNDIRSYRRADTEELLKANPGAFIIGEGPDSGENHEAPEPDRSTARGRRAAPNKARTTKPAETQTPPAETGSEQPPDGGQKPPAGMGAETKSE